MAGLLRSVKNPTAMGMSIKITDRQSITKPEVGDMVPELLIPFSSVLYGIMPVAVAAPKTQMNNPGQPHKTTAAIVAIIPFVLLSMVFFSFLI